MAIEGIQTRWSFPAGAAITQFQFVKLNSSGQVIPIAAATDVPIGVAQNGATAAGQSVSVCIIGITKLVSSAAMAVGAQVGTTATGTAVTIVAGTDTTKYLAGYVVEASTASPELCSAVINCANVGRAA